MTTRLTPANGDTVAQLKIAKAEGGLHLLDESLWWKFTHYWKFWENDQHFWWLKVLGTWPVGKGIDPQQTSRRRWRAEMIALQLKD